MFTGIVEELGTVETPGSRLTIQCSKVLDDLTQGASIAVNGVCLTAIGLQSDSLSADLAPETLRRSNLGDLRSGARVNLERPVTPATRLSGHIVQGHVDGTAGFVALQPLADGNWWLSVRIPGDLDRYVIHKGSITLDGVSLTIASLESGVAGVAIVPHTYENTVMREYRAGVPINVEVDLIGKYVEKLMIPR